MLEDYVAAIQREQEEEWNQVREGSDDENEEMPSLVDERVKVLLAGWFEACGLDPVILKSSKYHGVDPDGAKAVGLVFADLLNHCIQLLIAKHGAVVTPPQMPPPSPVPTWTLPLGIKPGQIYSLLFPRLPLWP
ncbi:unnamed protein product, partial [Chrysoparadoxa australica]